MSITIHGGSTVLKLEGKHYIIAPSINEYGDNFFFVGEVVDVEKGDLIKTYAQAKAVARRMAKED